MSDTAIITGQYVRITQTPASLGERFLARMIDLVIIALYIISTVVVISAVPRATSTSTSGEWIAYLFFILVYAPVWGYTFLFELFNEGQTPGKKAMNIKVVMLDGSTPALSGYLLRWLIYPIDAYITSGIGVLFILLTKNKQRLGDLAAGTMVIRMNNYRRIKVSLDEYKHLTDGYVPSYPQVVDLSFEQINVIIKVLDMKDKKRYMYISQLSKKLKDIMKVDSKNGDESFLNTVVRDYEYFAYVDI